MKLRIVMPVVVLVLLGGIAWGALRMLKATTTTSGTEVPATKVKKGRVTLTVAARGELQGGNSEMLTAPMSGGGDMAITSLRDPGEVVNTGDVVVQFDTTQQEYNLREAEADLAEAEQQVIQAHATSDATDEESAYQVLSTASDVKTAELELRKNPLLPAIQARQNQLALDAAKNRYAQAQQDLNNKKATSSAGIAIQIAAENKAKVAAQTAQKIIDSMTLKAKTSGYVNIQQNSNQNMIYWGMQLPPFQLGDTARAGMAVAQIPDLKSWEVSATIGELDRGHLSIGQKVSVGVVALAGKSFHGHVKNIGGTTGSPWDRKFECRIALDEAGPELRPGMTSNMVITLESMDDVLWVPSQALFESDGRTFVYMQSPNGFMPHDVTLVRRSESQAVLTGVKEGDLVAMSRPDEQNKSGGGSQSAMKALSK
ncbi:MAG TPA: efflux RND transporter periplasmic adaptor subunit [Bryobacteraceae bacterium]|nr:efflux RND transporter periplasmic adaptor subunit [Bryobacteraceae bacterium]